MITKCHYISIYNWKQSLIQLNLMGNGPHVPDGLSPGEGKFCMVQQTQYCRVPPELLCIVLLKLQLDVNQFHKTAAQMYVNLVQVRYLGACSLKGGLF